MQQEQEDMLVDKESLISEAIRLKEEAVHSSAALLQVREIRVLIL